MKSSISVLIPTKNRRDLLKRALESVFNQTVLPEEIIVVNDGSTDDTKEYLEGLLNSHSLLKIINREKSGGVNMARNQGINVANSEWVACLDDDDAFVSEAIETMKKRLQDMPLNYNLAYFNTEITNNSSSFIGGFQFDKFPGKYFYDPTYEERMTKFNLKGDCTQVFRKSLFGNPRYKFPENINGFESYAINLLSRDKKGIRYHKDVLTIVNQSRSIQHLSHSASQKNPWPFLVLHFKQLFQHWRFYAKHPLILFNKKITMLKLLLRVMFAKRS